MTDGQLMTCFSGPRRGAEARRDGTQRVYLLYIQLASMIGSIVSMGMLTSLLLS